MEILKGTVVLADAQRAVTVPNKGPNGSTICVPQLQRFFQRGDASINPNTVNPPAPGPTLRGQLGDVVEITFLNQINTLDYGDTIDLSEKGIGTGCDSVTNGSGYPNFPAGTTPASDTYPNCFHGSSAGNLHFHGTHTSPSYTADNVFLAISPSPRKNGMPAETACFGAARVRYVLCQLRGQAERQQPVGMAADLERHGFGGFAEMAGQPADDAGRPSMSGKPQRAADRAGR